MIISLWNNISKYDLFIFVIKKKIPIFIINRLERMEGDDVYLGAQRNQGREGFQFYGKREKAS